MIDNASASYLGIGSYGSGVSFDAPSEPARAQSPVVASDEIATGANAGNGAAPSLEAALGGTSPAAQVAASGAKAAVEATLAQVLGGLGETREALLLSQPAVARTLAELVLQQTAPTALPVSAAATLVSLASLVRGASLAATPAESALMLSRLASFLAERGPDVATAAAALQTPATSSSSSSIAVPAWDPLLRAGRSDDASAKQLETPEARRRDPRRHSEDLVPERDTRGRRYDTAQRARLAELGLDPRRGFAPEATAALAAEELLDMRFGRAADPRHDFLDQSGALWDVVVPADLPGLEKTLRRLADRANVIVSGEALGAGSRPAVRALLTRLTATTGLRRFAGVALEDE